jgi:Apea-like HEPN
MSKIIKVSLRPHRNVHKCLISTTSHLVGEFEIDGVLLTHAWPDFNGRNTLSRWSEGPASRSAFIFSFRTEDELVKSGAVPNYAPMGEMICGYLAVLFGKRFDNHGLLEGSGYFQIPDLSHFGHLCQHERCYNSHKERLDFAVPLNLVEVTRLKPLLEANAINPKFLRTFQTCSKFYLQALQSAERNPEIAYLHLITAIEVLSNFYEYDKNDLLDDETLKALQQIEAQLSDGEKTSKLFRGKLLQIRRRFLKAVLALVDNDFFTRSEASEPMFGLKQESFGECIAAAYDLRSKYVHTGVPFGSWVSLRVAGQNTEVQFGTPVVKEDPALGKLIGRAPTFVGLERVTRYVLLRAAQEQGAYVIEQSVQPNEPVG